MESQETPVFTGVMRRWLHWLDRRRHVRVTHRPLIMRIEGRRYETIDWSIGGARIDGYPRSLSPGDLLTGTIDSIRGEESGAFTAEVVRRSESGEIGLRFIEISALTLFAMENFKAA